MVKSKSKLFYGVVDFSLPHRDFEGLMQEIQEQSDRGAGILGGEFLKDVLEDLISVVLRKDKKLIEKLFNSRGALSDFDARIDVAYALGLITPEVHHDLHIVREIRNRFGHRPHGLTFETQEIRDRCKNFKYPQSLPQKSRVEKLPPRDIFLMTVVSIFGDLSLAYKSLQIRMEEVEKLKAKDASSTAEASKEKSKKEEEET